jgi:hypothetical protein
MPLVDSNDPALWDGGANSLYRSFPLGQQLGYTRDAAFCYLGNDVELLIAALESRGLTRGQRIALVGAGFGWVAEKFIAAGYGPAADGTANGKVAAIDTSTWIQSNKGNNATLTIVNADINGATGRRTVRQQFGSNNAVIDWAISEDVLPLLIGSGPTPAGNNEIQPFCSAMRQSANNVAHWVSTVTASGDTRLNWKTLSEWKAWCDPDIVIQRQGGAVL